MGNRKNSVTLFIFALLQWPGTEPAISPRYAFKNKANFQITTVTAATTTRCHALLILSSHRRSVGSVKEYYAPQNLNPRLLMDVSYTVFRHTLGFDKN